MTDWRNSSTQLCLGEPLSVLGLLIWAQAPERYLHHQTARFRKDAGCNSCIPHHAAPIATAPPESHGGCCSWQRDLWDLVIFWPSWVLGTFFLPRGSISDRRRCHHSAHFSQRKTIFLCENIHYHPKAWSPSQKLGMSGENHRFPHKLWASWSLVEWSTDSWVRVKSDKSIQIIYLK